MKGDKNGIQCKENTYWIRERKVVAVKVGKGTMYPVCGWNVDEGGGQGWNSITIGPG